MTNDRQEDFVREPIIIESMEDIRREFGTVHSRLEDLLLLMELLQGQMLTFHRRLRELDEEADPRQGQLLN